MAGSATFTIVPSRNATPEPSTVASSTHRAAVVPIRMGSRLRSDGRDQAATAGARHGASGAVRSGSGAPVSCR